MDERRSPAKRVAVTMFIGNSDDSVPLGKTRDISLSGVFVITGARPEIGSVRDVWFVWGEEIFSCQAKVVRHARDGVGITFVNPDDAFVRAVQEITGDKTTE